MDALFPNRTGECAPNISQLGDWVFYPTSVKK